ncbi:MAG TPA: hypothetical protein VFY10_14070 [Dehalococcoidia bacterium]|nr:hypothetical protein [Dehalococcoidia bacterium]
MNARAIKLGAASAIAGGALMVGGLVFGGALVSAQTPAPSPSTQEQTAPTTPSTQTPNNQVTPDNQAPSQNGQMPDGHDPADCPGMNGNDGGTPNGQGGSMYRDGSQGGTGNGASFHTRGGRAGFGS